MLNVQKCVDRCVSKYGLSEDEARRIVTTDNILLSVEELRYKYDDMKIGTEYPEWITPEEHMKMCYATVWKRYNTDFFWYNSCEDIAYDLFVYSSIHLHSYKDKFHLNGLLLCRLKNLIRDYAQEQQCYAEPYNWEVANEKAGVDTGEDKCSRYKKAYESNAMTINTEEVTDLVLTIESIKNEKIKGILLICGYFLANIVEFLNPLVVFYKTSSTAIKEKIYNLGRDDVAFCKAINKEVNVEGKENVTVGRVLKVFGKRDKAYIQTDIVPYLRGIGFSNI